jgi:hypothetical protein
MGMSSFHAFAGALALAVAAGGTAQAAVATDQNIATMIGQHFWMRGSEISEALPAGHSGCPKDFELIKGGTEFLVGVALGEKYRFLVDAKVTLDDAEPAL